MDPDGNQSTAELQTEIEVIGKRIQVIEDWMVDMASKVAGVEQLRDHYDKVIALCEKRLGEHSAIIDMLKDQHWQPTPPIVVFPAEEPEEKGNHGKEETGQ